MIISRLFLHQKAYIVNNKNMNTKLLSVSKTESGYQVSVSFGLNIIHGILTEIMIFEQKKWPKELSYWIDRPIDAPFFVSCDTSKLTYDYKEVRDGYEYWDVIVGCHGTMEVLGHADTKSELSVKFHKYGGVLYTKQYSKDPKKIYKRKYGAYLKFSLSYPYNFLSDRYYKSPFARKVFATEDLVNGNSLTGIDKLILRTFRKGFYGKDGKVRKRPPNYTRYYIDINFNDKKYASFIVEHQKKYVIDYLSRKNSITEKDSDIILICAPAILELLEDGKVKIVNQKYMLK